MSSYPVIKTNQKHNNCFLSFLMPYLSLIICPSFVIEAHVDSTNGLLRLYILRIYIFRIYKNLTGLRCIQGVEFIIWQRYREVKQTPSQIVHFFRDIYTWDWSIWAKARHMIWHSTLLIYTCRGLSVHITLSIYG